MTKPGQAAREAFERLGMHLAPHRTNENFRLLAQAAIDAAKSSGEVVQRSEIDVND